jgi:hypothetical protein
MAMSRFSRKSVLSLALGLLLAACSSSDERSLVLVDLQLGTGVSPPDTVHVSASQSSVEVKGYDIPWGGAGVGPKQVGVFVPSGVSGQVTISAKAFVGSAIVAEGRIADPVTLKSGGSVGPFVLVLAPPGVAPPVSDGGVDLAGSEAGASSPEVNDTATPESAVDAGRPETGRPDAAVDGGSVDGPGAPSDSAITQTDTSDGSAPTIDSATVAEVGHTMAWEPGQNIEKDSLSSTYYPVVAVDPINEHVYIAWKDDSKVKVKRWNRPSATWGNTLTLENRGDPNSVRIGADTLGNVMVVWAQNSNGASSSVDGVWMSRTADGATWSPAVRISQDAAFGVQFAMARNGTARAVYSKQTSKGWPLYTAYYDKTGWTENPTTLDSNTNYGSSEPLLALDAAGDGLLIFRMSWGIAGTALTGTSFTTPTMLDPNYQTVSAQDAAIAMNRKGEGIVVWSEASGSNTVALARTYNPSLGWSSVSNPLVTSSTVAALAVTLDEQSQATLLWQQNLKTGGANLMGMHGSMTGAWSDVAVLETDNRAGALNLTTEFAYPKVAIDGSGNVLVAWRKDLSDSSTTTYGAYATHFAAGTWSPQTKLGVKVGFDVPDLSIAVADSGFGAAAFAYIAGSATTADPDTYNAYVAFFR